MDFVLKAFATENRSIFIASSIGASSENPGDGYSKVYLSAMVDGLSLLRHPVKRLTENRRINALGTKAESL
jgi:hypothetical protein